MEIGERCEPVEPRVVERQIDRAHLIDGRDHGVPDKIAAPVVAVLEREAIADAAVARQLRAERLGLASGADRIGEIAGEL